MPTQQKRNRNAGKAHEKRIAQMLDGERKGLFGGVDVTGVHIGNLSFDIECKVKSNMPTYLRRHYEQARRHSQPGNVPTLVLHAKHQPYEDDLIVFRLADFIAMIIPELEK